MITGISGITLRVSDLDRAVAFYRDGLGLTVHSELSDPLGGVRLQIGCAAHLDLIGGGQRREKAYDFARFGYHHFCLSVGNIQRLADHLYKKGIIDVAEPTHNKDFNDGLWLEDPDGNAVEIVEYMPESPLMQANQGNWDYGQVGVLGIGHISFVVENMERSLHYYIDDLGFRRVLDLDDDMGQPFLIFLRVADGSFIELFYTGVRKDPDRAHASGFIYAEFAHDEKRETIPHNSIRQECNGEELIADPDGNRYILTRPF